MPHPILSIVIPVFNEVATVAAAIERVRGVPVHKEIIAVDDASTDGTRRILLQLYERGVIDQLVLHDRSYGKATAVRAGIKCATGKVIALQEAEMTHEPHELSRLLQPILGGEVDAVFGSRSPSAPQLASDSWHRAASRSSRLFSILLPGASLPRAESGFQLVRADLLQSLPLSSERLGLESELTARLAWAGARIQEVPVSSSVHPSVERKTSHWKDRMTTSWYMLRWHLLAPRATRLHPLPLQPSVRRPDRAPVPARAAA